MSWKSSTQINKCWLSRLCKRALYCRKHQINTRLNVLHLQGKPPRSSYLPWLSQSFQHHWMALLKKVLTHLNFDLNFLLWFKTLHANITGGVFNNRHASCLFPWNCSLRSGFLFVISLELLANLIKGITTGEKELKTTMYTDDMTVFVRNLDSITHLLNMLKKFQINTSKTDALWLNFGKTDKTLLSISIIYKILFVH